MCNMPGQYLERCRGNKVHAVCCGIILGCGLGYLHTLRPWLALGGHQRPMRTVQPGYILSRCKGIGVLDLLKQLPGRKLPCRARHGFRHCLRAVPARSVFARGEPDRLRGLSCGYTPC